jgi:hypothetical protein
MNGNTFIECIPSRSTYRWLLAALPSAHGPPWLPSLIFPHGLNAPHGFWSYFVSSPCPSLFAFLMILDLAHQTSQLAFICQKAIGQ